MQKTRNISFFVASIFVYIKILDFLFFDLLNLDKFFIVLLSLLLLLSLIISLLLALNIFKTNFLDDPIILILK